MSVPTPRAEEMQDAATDLVAARPNMAPRALRVLAVAAVCLGVAALAAATFVLSYSPIRAVALQAGITPRLARGYPLLLDAMLVIVLAAILALRGAGLPSRLLAWVTLLLVMTVAAGADAMYTAGRSLPHQAASITAAVLPFVLVLVAFALLLAMLRHARLSRLATTADSVSAYASAWSSAPLPEARGPELELPVAPLTDIQPTDARLSEAHSDPVADGPTADEPFTEPATGTPPYPAESMTTGDYYDDDDDTEPTDGEEPEDLGVTLTSVSAAAADAESLDDPDGPVFHRLFSAPVPAEAPAEDGPLTD
jgi:hypothetical protein